MSDAAARYPAGQMSPGQQAAGAGLDPWLPESSSASRPGSSTSQRDDSLQQHALSHKHTRHNRRMKLPRVRRAHPSAAGAEGTGTAHPLRSGEQAQVTCIDYGPAKIQVREHMERGLEQFLAEEQPPWGRVRWINVQGMHDHAAVTALAKRYQLHPLAIEDVLHVPQHPKVDQYPAEPGQPPCVFVVARMLQLADGHLQSKQVSIFLGHQVVLTFQEGMGGDVWGAVRRHLRSNDARLRQSDASFLLYALVDALVDECFPILDHYGDRLEQLESEILTNFHRDNMLQVHEIRRELLLLQRQMRPMREVIHSLTRESHPRLTEETRLYLRDVYDHLIQCVELLETYHELSMNLADMVNSNIANRVNDVMKVLTVIATIFIPISFLASVFGMNFMNIPGRHWPPAFAVFCAACAAMAGGMLLYFKRKDWL